MISICVCCVHCWSSCLHRPWLCDVATQLRSQLWCKRRPASAALAPLDARMAHVNDSVNNRARSTTATRPDLLHVWRDEQQTVPNAATACERIVSVIRGWRARTACRAWTCRVQVRGCCSFSAHYARSLLGFVASPHDGGWCTPRHAAEQATAAEQQDHLPVTTQFLVSCCNWSRCTVNHSTVRLSLCTTHCWITTLRAPPSCCILRLNITDAWHQPYATTVLTHH